MMKKIICVLSIFFVMFGITGCKDTEEYEVIDELIKQFDLSDPKIIWEGNINDMFSDDLVIVTLRKTSTYPELQLKHFGLDNAESLEYAGGVRPPDYFFTAGYEEALENYRQIVYIYIKSQGKAMVIETIRALEKLDFLKSAEPNGIGSGGV